MRRQQQDAERRHPAAQRHAEGDAVAVRQVDVQDHAVDQPRTQDAGRLGRRADGRDHLQAGGAGQGVLEHRAEQRLVLDDGDAQVGWCWEHSSAPVSSAAGFAARHAPGDHGRQRSPVRATDDGERSEHRMTTSPTDSAAVIAVRAGRPAARPDHPAARHRDRRARLRDRRGAAVDLRVRHVHPRVGAGAVLGAARVERRPRSWSSSGCSPPSQAHRATRVLVDGRVRRRGLRPWPPSARFGAQLVFGVHADAADPVRDAELLSGFILATISVGHRHVGDGHPARGPAPHPVRHPQRGARRGGAQGARAGGDPRPPGRRRGPARHAPVQARARRRPAGRRPRRTPASVAWTTTTSSRWRGCAPSSTRRARSTCAR